MTFPISKFWQQSWRFSTLYKNTQHKNHVEIKNGYIVYITSSVRKTQLQNAEQHADQHTFGKAMHLRQPTFGDVVPRSENRNSPHPGRSRALVPSTIFDFSPTPKLKLGWLTPPWTRSTVVLPPSDCKPVECAGKFSINPKIRQVSFK
jgi:hypothetical protein